MDWVKSPSNGSTSHILASLTEYLGIGPVLGRTSFRWDPSLEVFLVQTAHGMLNIVGVSPDTLATTF